MGILVTLAFVGILVALGSAGFFMLRGGRDDGAGKGRMARALAVRVALSIVLAACILGAYWMGWIQPTGFPVGR